MWLHCVVVLCWRDIIGLGDPGGDRQARFHVAKCRACRRTHTDGRGIVAFAAFQFRPGTPDFVLRVEQSGALGCRFQRFGDHKRDRLVHVAHGVVLQHFHAEPEGRHLLVRIMRQWRPVGRSEHLDNAGMRLRGRDVEGGDPPTRDPADGRHGVEHTFGMIVGGIGRATGNLEHAVAARQRLAGIGSVPAVLEVCGNGLKQHGMLRGLWRRARPASRA